jgi:hypothetical protein
MFLGFIHIYGSSLQINVSGLYSKNGATWVDASAHNPFNGDTKIYKEYALITSRYDIVGSFWKTGAR